MFHEEPAVGFNAGPVLVIVLVLVEAVEDGVVSLMPKTVGPPGRGKMAWKSCTKLSATVLKSAVGVEEGAAYARPAIVEKRVIGFIIGRRR